MERLESSLKKFYGPYEDLMKQYEVPLSRMLSDILKPVQIQWQPSTYQTLYQSVIVSPNSTFFRIMRGFNRTFTTGVHVDRGCLLLQTPDPVPCWATCVPLLEINTFPELVVIFRTMLFEYPSVLSRFCFLGLNILKVFDDTFILAWWFRFPIGNCYW